MTILERLVVALSDSAFAFTRYTKRTKATIVTLQNMQNSVRKPKSDERIVKVLQSWRSRKTYKPPIPKMKLKVAFRDRRIWRFQMTGIIRKTMAISVMMCGIEEPMKNQ